MRTIHILTLVLLTQPEFSIAQPQAFDAASIKMSKEGGGPYTRVLPGRLIMNYYSFQELIAFAYGVRAEQIVGLSLPDRNDIEAMTGGGRLDNHTLGPMLQTLLEDRFALRLHRETRDRQIYNLIVAKSGARMTPATGDCVVSPADGGVAVPPSPQGRTAGPVLYCNHPSFGARGSIRTLDGKGITMKALADSLSRTELNRTVVDKTVVDKTGLAGTFDVVSADIKCPQYCRF